jgi:hypothetical protein
LPKLRRDIILRSSNKTQSIRAHRRIKGKKFESFGNLPSQGEISSLGGGVTINVRSAREEEIWTIQSMSRHTGGVHRGG